MAFSSLNTRRQELPGELAKKNTIKVIPKEGLIMKDRKALDPKLKQDDRKSIALYDTSTLIRSLDKSSHELLKKKTQKIYAAAEEDGRVFLMDEELDSVRELTVEDRSVELEDPMHDFDEAANEHEPTLVQSPSESLSMLMLQREAPPARIPAVTVNGSSQTPASEGVLESSEKQANSFSPKKA